MFDPPSSGFHECLCELRNICGTRLILPSSYTPSPSTLDISKQPIASGGPGDVYQGTLNGVAVCIKRIQMYSKDGLGGDTKVCHPIASPSCC